MKIVLNSIDREKVRKIEETRKLNFDILEMNSAYLNNDPRYITKDLIDGLVNDCRVSEEYAFYHCCQRRSSWMRKRMSVTSSWREIICSRPSKNWIRSLTW